MKKDYCSITVLLDRSGSMLNIKNDIIGAFNSFIDSQKDLPGQCDISLYQFDDQYEVVYEGKNVKSTPLLNDENYVPRGWTRLLDGIGKTINNLGVRLSKLPENERPEKVLFVIITDGEENSSKEFKRNQIFEMIKLQKETYKWQFVFLGANQDAIVTGAQFGIGKNQSYTYSATSEGVHHLIGAIRSSTTTYRTSNSSQDFKINEEDREENISKIVKNKTKTN